MSLGRRLIIKTCLLIAGVAALGGTAVWGLSGLWKDARVARDEYVELRMIQTVVSLVDDVQERIEYGNPDRTIITDDLAAAAAQLDEFINFQLTQDDDQREHHRRETGAAESVRDHALAVNASLTSTSQPITSHHAVMIDMISAELDSLAHQMDTLIAETHAAAAARLRASIFVLGGMSSIIIIAAIVFGIRHYRSVMSPLRRLQRGVQSIASGQFSERVAVEGDMEFISLADDFNRMATQLDELYQELEEKVRTKSRELVRSERLASVGFLAAGVAHEINNPLNIISGYAELSLARIRKTIDADSAAETREALQIIRDEAFRCKEIVEKLLSLAKMGDGSRAPVSMAHVIEEVTSMVRAHNSYRDRRLKTEFSVNDDLTVWGNEAELKQVLLNLVINGLNASPRGTGCVTIAGLRESGHVIVRVDDNGRGMCHETLERVFEPFFTQGPGETGRGAGLGLAIAHAIVEAHGGAIRAESGGPGKGSRFTVTLPQTTRTERHGQAA